LEEKVENDKVRLIENIYNEKNIDQSNAFQVQQQNLEFRLKRGMSIPKNSIC
jgi:hypothetical protein